jgi:polyferredoxin
MCALRLWLSLFLFFTLGLVMTLVTGKKTFCAGYCPMGALQDASKTTDRRKPLKLSKSIQWMIFILFWGIISVGAWIAIQNPYEGWSYYFKFMVSIAALSLILQMFYANRTWCTAMCPMGRTYAWMLKSKIKK